MAPPSTRLTGHGISSIPGSRDAGPAASSRASSIGMVSGKRTLLLLCTLQRGVRVQGAARGVLAQFGGVRAAEQGWRIDWVWKRAGKGGVQPPVVEVPGGGPMAVGVMATLVSTPCSRPNKGKRKAVSEPEVPRHMHQRLSPAPPTFEGGPLGLNVDVHVTARL
ncbi:hypothetical protein C0992_005973 [Termitomyces sp. T32_za158]|nr:hypothetical protein C0992_005973 [Termitomyces sp. T32_za158]